MIRRVVYNQNIIWTCSQCIEEISKKDVSKDGISAGLMMSHKEMQRAQESEIGWAEYERKQEFKSVNLGEMMLTTKDLQKGDWAVYCSKCIVDKNDVYFIEISRIQTVMEFLSWTIHLKEKGWALHTNWDDIARELLSVGRCKE